MAAMKERFWARKLLERRLKQKYKTIKFFENEKTLIEWERAQGGEGGRGQNWKGRNVVVVEVAIVSIEQKRRLN